MTPVAFLTLAGAFVLGGAAMAQTRDPQPIQCAKAENECLRALGSLAERRGDVLTLRFRNGKTKTYATDQRACDDGDADKCQVHNIVEYRPAQQLVVVASQSYEGGGSEVANTRTGAIATLATLPEFSPNGRWFVSIGSDDANDYGYDVRIWDTPSDGPKLALDYVAPEGTYESWTFVAWESNRRIKLTVSKWFGNQLEEVPAEAVFGEGKWSLVVSDAK